MKNGLVARVAMWFAVSLALGLEVKAQSAKDASGTLFQTVAALDRTLFEAYNGCDLPKLGALVSDDLEFYHDKTGLAVGRTRFLVSIQKNICGKVRRELVISTLEVHPLDGYGAVEIGTHRFFHHSSKNQEELSGEAKFVMLWKNKDETWTLTRVISYDHDSSK